MRTVKNVSLTRLNFLCYYIKKRQSLPSKGKVLRGIESLVKDFNSDKS